MMVRATSAGDLARGAVARHGEGRVGRVFPRALYLDAGASLVVVLNGGLRSPITVNVDVGRSLQELVKPGDVWRFEGGTLRVGRLSLGVRGAATYAGVLRGGLGGSEPLERPRLERAGAMLRLLYQASPGRPLPADPAFLSFVSSTSEFASRGGRGPRRFGDFAPLIGRGSGFTPSGDDFLAGFAAAHNFGARAMRWARVRFAMGDISARTVRESAALLWYATRGCVDQETEGLILASCGGGEGLGEALTRMAARGHTSGMDMALGVLVAAAEMGERARRDRSLEALAGAVAS